MISTSIVNSALPAWLNVIVTRLGRASGGLGSREVSTDQRPTSMEVLEDFARAGAPTTTPMINRHASQFFTQFSSNRGEWQPRPSCLSHRAKAYVSKATWQQPREARPMQPVRSTLFDDQRARSDFAAMGRYKTVGCLASWYSVTVTVRASLPDSSATTPSLL
jgi:hypothetical protein